MPDKTRDKERCQCGIFGPFIASFANAKVKDDVSEVRFYAMSKGFSVLRLGRVFLILSASKQSIFSQKSQDFAWIQLIRGFHQFIGLTFGSILGPGLDVLTLLREA